MSRVENLEEYLEKVNHIKAYLYVWDKEEQVLFCYEGDLDTSKIKLIKELNGSPSFKFRSHFLDRLFFTSGEGKCFVVDYREGSIFNGNMWLLEHDMDKAIDIFTKHYNKKRGHHMLKIIEIDETLSSLATLSGTNKS